MNDKVVSPAAELLGREILSRDPATGEVFVRYDARKEFFNRNGIVHGGFIAAMLDSVTGLAIGARVPEGSWAVTTRLDTRFRKIAGVGPIFGRARVVEGDARDVRIEGELTSEGGDVIATATAEMRILKRRA
ncbi:MAG: PaaI family thioesterase [Rhodoblastus sp.]